MIHKRFLALCFFVSVLGLDSVEAGVIEDCKVTLSSITGAQAFDSFLSDAYSDTEQIHFVFESKNQFYLVGNHQIISFVRDHEAEKSGHDYAFRARVLIDSSLKSKSLSAFRVGSFLWKTIKLDANQIDSIFHLERDLEPGTEKLYTVLELESLFSDLSQAGAYEAGERIVPAYRYSEALRLSGSGKKPLSFLTVQAWLLSPWLYTGPLWYAWHSGLITEAQFRTTMFPLLSVNAVAALRYFIWPVVRPVAASSIGFFQKLRIKREPQTPTSKSSGNQ